MPDLYAALIRHSEYHQLKNAPSALQPLGITKAGVRKCAAAVYGIDEFVREQGCDLISEIDSSLLLRAWQTAQEIIKGVEGLETVTAFDALNERSVGSVANLTVSEIEKIFDFDPRYDKPPKFWKSNSYYKLPFPGAESLMDSGERVAKHLDERMTELYTNIQTDTLKVFVGHGASIRHAAYQLGIMEFDDITKLSMYHCQPVIIKYNPEGAWEHVGGLWKVRAPKSEFTD